MNQEMKFILFVVLFVLMTVAVVSHALEKQAQMPVSVEVVGSTESSQQKSMKKCHVTLRGDTSLAGASQAMDRVDPNCITVKVNTPSRK